MWQGGRREQRIEVWNEREKGRWMLEIERD
jgi:hypothetical protein